MSTSDAARPDFNAIVLETNVLIAHQWPSPIPALLNLIALAHWWGIEVFLPEPVLIEAEAHWLRRVQDAAQNLSSAQKKLTKAARPLSQQLGINVTHATLPVLREHSRIQSAACIANQRIQLVSYTERSARDLFEHAVEYRRPFAPDGEGKGFQDAVVLTSILDDLLRNPERIGALVTNDGDFSHVDVRAFSPSLDPSRLQVMNSETAFRKLFGPHFEETRVKPYRRLLHATEERARADVETLTSFVRSQLTPDMLSYRFGELTREILSIDRLDVLGVDVPFPESAATTTIDLTIKVAASGKASAVIDYSFLGALSGERQQPGLPPKDEEKPFTWFGLIRGEGTVVEGELVEITPRSLASES